MSKGNKSIDELDVSGNVETLLKEYRIPIRLAIRPAELIPMGKRFVIRNIGEYEIRFVEIQIGCTRGDLFQSDHTGAQLYKHNRGIAVTWQ